MRIALLFLSLMLASAPVSADQTRFTPLDIADLVAWYDVRTLNVASGEPVSLWPDSSGNGYDMTQSLIGRPVYKNGAVDFDGVYDSMQTGVVSHGIGTGDFWWIAVVQPETVGGQIEILSHSNGSPALSTGNEYIFFSSPDGDYHFTDLPLIDDRWYILEVWRDNGTLYAAANGIQSRVTYRDGSFFPDKPMGIGMALEFSRPWDGAIREIIIVASAPSVQEQAQLRQYLRAK